jgi:hypothetical protein
MVVRQEPHPGDDAPAAPAVFRGGVWRLYGAGFGYPTVQAVMKFGRRGDLPVVGDWNGDGRTDIGTVRRGTWRLAIRRTEHPRTWRRFAFGPRNGQPVATTTRISPERHSWREGRRSQQ